MPRLRAVAILSAGLLSTPFLARGLRAQPPTMSQQPGIVNVTPPPSIAVTGSGEDVVVPDRARVSLGVQTQAPTAAEASQRNAQIQRAVLDAVRGLGIPAEQITTSDYSVSPATDYNPQTRRTRITGYTVSNTVTIEVRQTSQVGPVLDAALAKGANNVNSLQFFSSTAEASRRRALARAVERARADAEAMATAAGGRLGGLVELTSGYQLTPPRPIPMMAMAARSADAPTPISEGTETTTATVTGRWAFVPSR